MEIHCGIRHTDIAVAFTLHSSDIYCSSHTGKVRDLETDEVLGNTSCVALQKCIGSKISQLTFPNLSSLTIAIHLKTKKSSLCTLTCISPKEAHPRAGGVKGLPPRSTLHWAPALFYFCIAAPKNVKVAIITTLQHIPDERKV